MAGLIYGLCAVTALTVAMMLLRAYREGRYRLLLWSSVCFVGLTASNVLLVVDKLVITFIDLTEFRQLVTLASMLILLHGLIWDTQA